MLVTSLYQLYHLRFQSENIWYSKTQTKLRRYYIISPSVVKGNRLISLKKGESASIFRDIHDFGLIEARFDRPFFNQIQSKFESQ